MLSLSCFPFQVDKTNLNPKAKPNLTTRQRVRGPKFCYNSPPPNDISVGMSLLIIIMIIVGLRWRSCSEFVGSILAKDSCEMNQSTPCRNSWVFSGCSSNFFPQGKLTGWIRINTLIRSNIMYNCCKRIK
jgi:hypothetical protein